jgi:hypothetical protein
MKCCFIFKHDLSELIVGFNYHANARVYCKLKCSLLIFSLPSVLFLIMEVLFFELGTEQLLALFISFGEIFS